MAKHKMIQFNLLKNSIAAYFAAIEIHNKPNISYRYETVTLLMLNAWELLLKAYIKKYIKNRSIFAGEHTISFNKAVDFVNEDINSKEPRSFLAIKENLKIIEVYRNNIAHFYDEQLIPHIFMLVARCAINYTEFMKLHFGKDILDKEELFIMPIGFKLPFKPEEFLSRNSQAYVSSKEAKAFIDNIITVTTDLKAQGIEESIVLGFNIYMESVKKAKNSDLLVAVTASAEAADAVFVKTTKIQLTDDPNVPLYKMSDDEFREIWQYGYWDMLDWCKSNILNFKQDDKFRQFMRELKADNKCAYKRCLDSHNPKSVSKYFYNNNALKQLKAKYAAMGRIRQWDI
jgi:hypothetical protein